MKAYCLASSSAGNCFILEFQINGSPTRIMVECGLPMKETMQKLNEYGILMSSIECCLITHAHGDHCKNAEGINARGIGLFAHKSTLQALNIKGGELIPNQPKKVCNGLFVMAFEVNHDINGAVGFVIKTKEETVIFINDNKYWSTDLRNFKPDYVFIESNYDHQMVYAQYNELKHLRQVGNLNEKELKETNIKISQHERNINSHMSLHGTIKGLHKLNLINCKAIFLIHLSDRYANEYKMKNSIQAEFGIKTLVCQRKGGIK